MAYYTANKKIYFLFSNSSRYTVFSPKYYMGPVPGEFNNNNVYKSWGGGGGQQNAPFARAPKYTFFAPKNFASALSSISLETSLQNAKFGGGRYITRDVHLEWGRTK